MTYTSNIPQSGETLGSTRARINTNFQEIATVEAVNHIAFNDGDAGKHKFLQMPVQAAPTTAASEGGVFVKDDANMIAQLYYKGESEGSSYQLTTATDGADAAIGTIGASNGWSFLPGGVLIQWGSDTAPAGTSGFFTYPRAFGATPYSLQVSLVRTSSSSSSYDLLISTLDATQFKTNSGFSNPHTFYWMAIGIPA